MMISLRIINLKFSIWSSLPTFTIVHILSNRMFNNFLLKCCGWQQVGKCFISLTLDHTQSPQIIQICHWTFFLHELHLYHTLSKKLIKKSQIFLLCYSQLLLDCTNFYWICLTVLCISQRLHALTFTSTSKSAVFIFFVMCMS